MKIVLLLASWLHIPCSSFIAQQSRSGHSEERQQPKKQALCEHGYPIDPVENWLYIGVFLHVPVSFFKLLHSCAWQHHATSWEAIHTCWLRASPMTSNDCVDTVLFLWNAMACRWRTDELRVLVIGAGLGTNAGLGLEAPSPNNKVLSLVVVSVKIPCKRWLRCLFGEPSGRIYIILW